MVHNLKSRARDKSYLEKSETQVRGHVIKDIDNPSLYDKKPSTTLSIQYDKKYFPSFIVA